jgi:hypothetical protein
MGDLQTTDKMTFKLDTPYAFLLEGTNFQDVNEVKIHHPDPSIQWKTEIIKSGETDQLEVHVTPTRVSLHPLFPQVSQLTVINPKMNGFHAKSTAASTSEQPSSTALLTMKPSLPDSENHSFGICIVQDHGQCDPPQVCVIGFSITISIFVEIVL